MNVQKEKEAKRKTYMLVDTAAHVDPLTAAPQSLGQPFGLTTVPTRAPRLLLCGGY